VVSRVNGRRVGERTPAASAAAANVWEDGAGE